MILSEVQAEEWVGLLIEQVEGNSPATSVGLLVGDRLLRYNGILILSPAHWQALVENTTGTDRIVVEIWRVGETYKFFVPIGSLGVQVRPWLSEAVLNLYEQARQARNEGKDEVWLECLEEAARLALEREEQVGANWLWMQMGSAYEKRSNLLEAQSAYASVASLEGENEDVSEKYLCWMGLGRCEERLNDFRGAEQHYRLASECAEASSQLMWQAASLNGLGIVARLCGDLSAAQDYYQRSLDIREHLAPGSLDVAASLNNLGLVATHRCNLSAAQDYYQRALDIRERLAPGSLDVAASLEGLGFLVYSRGDVFVGKDYYQRSLDIRERLAPGSRDVANSLNGLGYIAIACGDMSVGQDYHQRALNIFERLVPGSLPVASILNNLGEVAYRHGDLSAAQDYHLRALDIWERLAPGSHGVTHTLRNLGDIAVACGDLSAAQGYHQRAFDMWERLAPESLMMARSLSKLGRVYDHQGQHTKALPLHLQAIRIVENHRAQIDSTQARSFLISQHLEDYFALIHCQMALNQLPEAYHTLERCRARSLGEMMSERKLDDLAEAPAGVLQEQQQLDEQLQKTHAALANLSATQDAEQIQMLHTQLNRLHRQQEDLTARIHRIAPHFAALQYPQPLDLAGAQAVLDDDTLALVYQTDEEQTFLFALTATTLDVSILPVGRQALQEQVRNFRRALDVRRIGNDPQQAVILGHQLYQTLMEPAKQWMKKAGQLLLCPEGPLHALPFAALVTNTGRKVRYLGGEKPLQSALSLTVYAFNRTERGRLQAESEQPQTETATRTQVASSLSALPSRLVAATRRLLALGDPIYALAGQIPAVVRSAASTETDAENPHTEAEGGGTPPTEPPMSPTTPVLHPELAALQTRGLSLAPLPHARQEVQALSTLFGEQAVVKLGADATRSVVLTEGAEVDVLHFACHGWLDPQVPMSSGLVLSPAHTSAGAAESIESVAGDNGLLQAWEILRKVKLKAELVVLSACQTGLGKDFRGEGLIGLSRAFQYAGAQNLVLSLWEIGDASTAEFMEAFYLAWTNGSSLAGALQEAMMQLQSHPRWKHPFYWSAFVLMGSAN